MRPLPVFRGFIGQRRVVAYVQRLLHGALSSGKAFPHTLLLGGSGLGKTHLAQAIAEEYGTELHVVRNPEEFGAEALARESEKWSSNDFLFLDEAHLLRPGDQERLFQLMEENRVPALEEAVAGKRQKVSGTCEAAAVTVVAATDRPGSLRRALLKRFPVNLELNPYSLREMILIVRQEAAGRDLLLTSQAWTALAHSAQGVPRLARHMLDGLRFYFADAGLQKIAKKHVREFLTAQGVDRFNRTPLQQRFMECLGGRTGRGASVRTLALALHLDHEFVMNEVEPFLVASGWVGIGPGGRSLTEAGEAVAASTRKGGAE